MKKTVRTLNRWWSRPINRERRVRFRRHKRARFSFFLFSILFVITLFSEFIANDKPVLLYHEGKLYTPVLFSYSETEFGGEFELEADYRDPYVQDLINSDGWMLWPPIRFHYSTINYDLPSPAPSPPTRENLLGTDDKGQDVLARLLYGFRISVLFGLTLTFFSSVIGVTVGALMGYYGGRIDLLGQRFMEVWGSIPTLFLLILLSSVVQPNFWWLLGITLLFGWMGFVGVVRAEFLRARNFEYVLAAKALGLKDPVIMFKHILPNALVATLTFLPFTLAGSITTLTSLDFSGIRTARRLPISWRTAGPGQSQSAGSVAGHISFYRAGIDFKPSGFCWRRRAGRYGSKENQMNRQQYPIVKYKNFHGYFKGQDRWREVIHGIDFTINEGETLALVGESGSGKNRHRHLPAQGSWNGFQD